MRRGAGVLPIAGPGQWLADLAPLGTGPEKPFLEIRAYLIAVFVETTSRTPDESAPKNYYASTSTGIAVGILITALHNAGLACLPALPAAWASSTDSWGGPPANPGARSCDRLPGRRRARAGPRAQAARGRGDLRLMLLAATRLIGRTRRACGLVIGNLISADRAESNRGD